MQEAVTTTALTLETESSLQDEADDPLLYNRSSVLTAVQCASAAATPCPLVGGSAVSGALTPLVVTAQIAIAIMAVFGNGVTLTMLAAHPALRQVFIGRYPSQIKLGGSPEMRLWASGDGIHHLERLTWVELAKTYTKGM